MSRAPGRDGRNAGRGRVSGPRAVPPLRALPDLDEHQTLREEVIEKLHRLGGERLVRQLVELFASGAPPRLAAIRSAVGAGDPATVEREAHALKSSAGNLGAMRMWAICQRLESLAAEGQLSLSAGLVEQLENEFGRVSPRLAGRVKGETR